MTTIRSKLAVAAGRMVKWGLSTFTKGGSSFPGKVALAIQPTVLKDLSKDVEVIVVSGTNGKTLTTSLIVQLLSQKYDHIITNPTGANLTQGIVSTFLKHRPKKGERTIAVLEIDEATIRHVTKYITPKLFVFTNIFRDQMDRFGEIYTTYEMMLEGVKNAPEATVLSNGDAPIFNSKDIPNPKLFFGFDHQEDSDVLAHYNSDGVLCPHCHQVLHYKQITYSNLGKYYCPHCQFKRPSLDFSVTAIEKLSLKESTFKIDGHEFTLQIAGLYNMYNALAAYSVARLFDVSVDEIRNGFKSAQRVFGRQEVFHVEEKEVMLNLIKNPVGFNQIIQLLSYEEHPFSLAVLLNDNYADGQDVSWIWDGDFEQLTAFPIQKLAIGGLRVEDLAVRMEVAGKPQAHVVNTNEQLIEWMKQAPTQKVNILATYTALLDLRKDLAKAGYMKEGMGE